MLTCMSFVYILFLVFSIVPSLAAEALNHGGGTPNNMTLGAPQVILPMSDAPDDNHSCSTDWGQDDEICSFEIRTAVIQGETKAKQLNTGNWKLRISARTIYSSDETEISGVLADPVQVRAAARHCVEVTTRLSSVPAPSADPGKFFRIDNGPYSVVLKSNGMSDLNGNVVRKFCTSALIFYDSHPSVKTTLVGVISDGNGKKVADAAIIYNLPFYTYDANLAAKVPELTITTPIKGIVSRFGESRRSDRSLVRRVPGDRIPGTSLFITISRGLRTAYATDMAWIIKSAVDQIRLESTSTYQAWSVRPNEAYANEVFDFQAMGNQIIKHFDMNQFIQLMKNVVELLVPERMRDVATMVPSIIGQIYDASGTLVAQYSIGEPLAGELVRVCGKYFEKYVYVDQPYGGQAIGCIVTR